MSRTPPSTILLSLCAEQCAAELADEYRTERSRCRLQQGQRDLGVERVRRDSIEHLRGLNIGEVGAEDVLRRPSDQGRRQRLDDQRPEEREDEPEAQRRE